MICKGPSNPKLFYDSVNNKLRYMELLGFHFLLVLFHIPTIQTSCLLLQSR